MKRTAFIVVLLLLGAQGPSVRAQGPQSQNVPCPDCPPGTYLFRFFTGPHSGREYRVHGNPDWQYNPIPYGFNNKAVVLNFHGITSSAAAQETLSGMDALAEAERFYVVYPEGENLSYPADTYVGPTGLTSYDADHTPAWRAGPRCCPSGNTTSGIAPYTGTNAKNDVNFAIQILDDLAILASNAIDTKRVYATGFSNGGFMAYRLGCERPDRIAAIAVVGGSLDLDIASCAAAPNGRKLPLVQFHGNNDPKVPLGGATQRTIVAGPSAIRRIDYSFISPPMPAATMPATEFWSTMNGCSTVGFVPKIVDASMTCYVAKTQDLSAECPLSQQISLCLTTSGPAAGHAWPALANHLMWHYRFKLAPTLP